MEEKWSAAEVHRWQRARVVVRRQAVRMEHVEWFVKPGAEHTFNAEAAAEHYEPEEMKEATSLCSQPPSESTPRAALPGCKERTCEIFCKSGVIEPPLLRKHGEN